MAKSNEMQSLSNQNITQNNGEILEQVVIGGDLKSLSPADRVTYYKQVCESIGLNPLTKPFEYIVLNNKLTLYARKDCTDQLRSIKKISIKITSREKIEDVYIITVMATDPSGRTDESTGVMHIGGLKGEALANAVMKCESKAKRRVTLSIAGLGMLDATEANTIPDAKHADVDQATGEIIDSTIDNKVEIDRLTKLINVQGMDAWKQFNNAEKKLAWNHHLFNDSEKKQIKVWAEKSDQIKQHGLMQDKQKLETKNVGRET